MNPLSENIESLLLDHECVVLPQFGAFVTQKGAAIRTEEEGIFFPPMRAVRFLQEVTEDDGLLAKRMQATSESEAKRRVQEMVLGLRQQLLADGQAEMGSIGQLLQDEDGHVSFEACQAGAVTPQYYGLDAFAFPKLSDIQHATPHAAKQQREALRERVLQAREENHNYITIRISRATLNYVATIAAILCICLLVASPLSHITSPLSQQAHFNTFELPAATQVNSTSTAPKTTTKKVVKHPTTVEIKNTVSSQAKESQKAHIAQGLEKASVTTPDTYCIVLASAISSRNADNYVETLHKRGMTNARITFNGKMRRVILDGYASEAEAMAEAKRIHSQKEFASAWTMRTPKE